jgi:myosin heavy subunit
MLLLLLLFQGALGRDGASLPASGIIPALDTVCREPVASDERYCRVLHSTQTRHGLFLPTLKKDLQEQFCVKHYAGAVQYTVRGWVSRNSDRVPEGFQVGSSVHTL